VSLSFTALEIGFRNESKRLTSALGDTTTNISVEISASEEASVNVSSSPRDTPRQKGLKYADYQNLFPPRLMGCRVPPRDAPFRAATRFFRSASLSSSLEDDTAFARFTGRTGDESESEVGAFGCGGLIGGGEGDGILARGEGERVLVAALLLPLPSDGGGGRSSLSDSVAECGDRFELSG